MEDHFKSIAEILFIQSFSKMLACLLEKDIGIESWVEMLKMSELFQFQNIVRVHSHHTNHLLKKKFIYSCV